MYTIYSSDSRMLDNAKMRVRTLIMGKVKVRTLIMGKMKVSTLILALSNVSEPLLFMHRTITFSKNVSFWIYIYVQ